VSGVWIAIVLSGIGTFAMRASFLAVAHRMVVVPPGAQRLLRQIPPAALASIVVPALVRHDGQIDLLDPRFVAGVLAAIIAWRTKSTIWTLVVGMGVLIVLEQI
jgi:branched-subunit amino acid transport protein